MGPRALLKRISAGAVHNVRFADVVSLVEALGFERQRTEGSHQLFWHKGILEELNLQTRKGEAKAYQLRYLVRLVERYNLKLED